jgi:hypothetical protein
VAPQSSTPPQETPLAPHQSGSIPSPPAVTAAPASQPVNLPTSPTSPISKALPDPTDPGDDVFHAALQKHKNKLSITQQNAFLANGTSESANKLLSMVQDLDQQHLTKSLLRELVIKAQSFLQATDSALKVLAVPAQYNQVAQVVIGGLKVFLDVCYCQLEKLHRIV